jgi:type IV pilus assembly protein PilV
MVSMIRAGRQRKIAAGFTLIELLIAITILAVGMMAVATMQVAAMKTNAKAARYSEATNQAQDRLERLIAMAYTDVNLVSGNETVDNCTVTWTVATLDLDTDGTEDAKQITVESSFRDAIGGATRKVTLRYVKSPV